MEIWLKMLDSGMINLLRLNNFESLIQIYFHEIFMFDPISIDWSNY